MNKQLRHFLLYCALLVLTHGLAVTIAELDVIGYESLLYYLILVCPLIVVPLVFSFKIQSFQQFAAYLLVTIIIWQLSFIFDDWMAGRLSDPLSLRDKKDTWGLEVFRRTIVPVMLISVGALLGQYKSTPRLR